MNIRTITRNTTTLLAAGMLCLGTAACSTGDDSAGDPGGAAEASDTGGASDSGSSDNGGARDDGGAGEAGSGAEVSADGDGSDAGGDTGGGSGASAGASDEGSDQGGASDEGQEARSGSGSDDDVTDCSADDLDASVQQEDSSAGKLHYSVDLTNTSDDPCRIAGYPGVSAVGDDNGTQIGASAQRADDKGEATVLIPNAHAEATIEATNVGDDGGPLGDTCDPQDADGFRIYPPDQKDALYAEADGLSACTANADWMTVTGLHPAS